ncbi:NHL repeat-containing protein [Venturia nashicola]|uniref:NHL repeat-containing protein n=1 Tax=Venturia nashicola TaxID=86259 RepID=A0A4Z1PVR8_9PEZI|nr:NHL repeat-containing protein [Venturia nashicola]TLD39038.1 NHL repeat-containing protein [Venturia nashicola]
MSFSNLVALVLAIITSKLTSATPVTDGSFTFYDMPTPLSGPCDLATGPDGALWVQNILVDTIVRIDPVSGQVSEYNIPYTIPGTQNPAILPALTNGRTALACVIRAGNDGNLYAASGLRNQFLRINPSTRKIDVFTPPDYNPLGDLQPFNDLTPGPTGMYFSQTTANLISHFDYVTEDITSFAVPTPLAAPLGMVFFRGYLWYAELLGNKIARFDPVTNRTQEYPLPLSLLGPAVVRATFSDPDRVCFTAFLGGANGCIGADTGKIDVYPNTGLAPALSLPAENTRDLRYNDIVYYSTASQNYINILNLTSGSISKVTEPGTVLAEPISLPFYFDIGMNYGPGNAVWFTEATTNRVGRYQV